MITTTLAAVRVSRSPMTGTVGDLSAYHVAFLVAAGMILLATFGSWTIHDEDADSTRVRAAAKRQAGTTREAAPA